MDHVKDLQICHGSTTDILQSATVIQGQVCGCRFDCFLILKPFPCQSVADPVRSGYVLGDICLHGSNTDERGCHKDIQDGCTDNMDTHG